MQGILLAVFFPIADSDGNEVGLLCNNVGFDLFSVEIKAGMTVTSSYFKRVEQVC